MLEDEWDGGREIILCLLNIELRDMADDDIVRVKPEFGLYLLCIHRECIKGLPIDAIIDDQASLDIQQTQREAGLTLRTGYIDEPVGVLRQSSLDPHREGT